jgi:hypothetical protein
MSNPLSDEIDKIDWPVETPRHGRIDSVVVALLAALTEKVVAMSDSLDTLVALKLGDQVAMQSLQARIAALEAALKAAQPPRGAFW